MKLDRDKSKQEIIKELGLIDDTRSKMQVILDLKENGTAAYSNIHPSSF